MFAPIDFGRSHPAAVGLSHLKRVEFERLEPLLRGMQIFLTNNTDWADEFAAKLHEEMPWMISQDVWS
jgi:hypothetical protein